MDDVEIQALKQSLFEWQKPHEVLQRLDEISSKDLFNKTSHAFTRDAWIAATFANHRQYDLVRLIKENQPDFEIKRVGYHPEMFEATEAMDPDRKRGNEYKKSEFRLHRDGTDDVAEWRRQASLIPEILATAAQKKAAKSYPPGCNLVVYLNITTYGFGYEHVPDFPSYLQAAASAFDNVWVLWNEKPYPCWKQGNVVVQDG